MISKEDVTDTLLVLPKALDTRRCLICQGIPRRFATLLTEISGGGDRVYHFKLLPGD